MNRQNKRKLLSNFMLIVAAVIWGSNYVFQKNVATEIGPFLFMSARSFLGALTMLPIICFTRKNQPTIYSKQSFLSLMRLAAFCGIINVTGSVLVQFGLIFTNASKAGFLNSLYIIFVPIMGLLFFQKKANRSMWIGIFLAVIGLYHLCLASHLTINVGDLIVLCSTLFFAMHIQLIAKYVQHVNGMHLSCLEFFFASIFCLLCAFIFEQISMAQIIHCAPSIIFAGILGIGVCYALQVTAQKYTDPTVAALLMSLESVFGALGGILFLGESFTTKEFIGVLFIIGAVIIAQLPSTASPHPKQ